MTDRVLLVTDPGTDPHYAAGHVERPERREAAAAGVRDAAGGRLLERGAAPADHRLLSGVHDAGYLAALEEIERGGGGWLDSDTYLVEGSSEAARLAAGATVEAARAAVEGVAAVAFAVARPPGHHAAAARGSGFCLLNNVAIAVAALRGAGLARRIAIVDWDVHHGDGTQAIFDADPEVWYGSTHQQPLYPGTGARSESGSGAAAGTKQNRLLAPGSGDGEFTAAWRDDLMPALEAFAPQAILVSAGYDAHRDDPLASLLVTEAGYAAVAREVGRASARMGLGGVALTLEGGYDLDALRASAAVTVRGLIAGRAEPVPE
ncbi:MAG: histone deacetylase [Chloroflexi bacterium]|nr:histone deacetylase [Chloroflexota bacterium]